jgi:hypothetical protein
VAELHVPGRTFPVKQYYLEDLMEVRAAAAAAKSMSKLPRKAADGRSVGSGGSAGKSLQEEEEDEEWEEDGGAAASVAADNQAANARRLQSLKPPPGSEVAISQGRKASAAVSPAVMRKQLLGYEVSSTTADAEDQCR